MTTCSRPFARAKSPIFSQYLAESCSSPSIMVDPWEKKCTGAILPFLVFPTAILSYGYNFRYAESSGAGPLVCSLMDGIAMNGTGQLFPHTSN